MSRQLQWVSADGTQTITLTDAQAGYRVLADTTGLNAPPYRFSTEQYTGIDGTDLQAVTADARTVVLALMVQASDQTVFRSRVAALTRAMRPKAGPAQLVATDEVGVVRRLTCRYKSGLEGSEARGTKLPGRWWRASVELYAPDPWWYGDQRTVDVGLGAGQSFFPLLPVRLAPSAVQGRFTVDLSASDAPSYPLWTVTGPGSALTLTNLTTGRQIVVNAPLAAGETMTIDTRPGYQSVRRGDGTNLMGSVATDPALWPLVEAVNDVTAALTGATATSRITGTYQPRYAGI